MRDQDRKRSLTLFFVASLGMIILGVSITYLNELLEWGLPWFTGVCIGSVWGLCWAWHADMIHMEDGWKSRADVHQNNRV